MTSEEDLLVSLDKLFEAATKRYSHAGIDDFMLRLIIEATLPMAPVAAKDKCRRLLATNGGLFGNKAFQKHIYSLFVADSSTTAIEFLSRVEGETQRMLLYASKAGSILSLTDEERDGNAKYFLPSRAEERVVTQERSILELESEIKRLKMKCGELPVESNGSTNATLTPSSALIEAQGIIPGSQPAEVTTTESSHAAYHAIMALEHQNAQTASALARANEKLHRYGRFYDRKGDIVHNARIIAASTRHPNDNGTYISAPLKLASISRGSNLTTFVPVANARGPLTADEAMQMILSSPPKKAYAGTTENPEYINPARSPYGYTSPHQQRHDPNTSLAYRPANPSSTPPPVSDYSAVTVALPNSNLSRPSDTLLSMSMPLSVEDVKDTLLKSPQSLRRPPSQPISTSNIGSPYEQRNGTSRLESMYHILGLERQETNRWRTYGSSVQ